MVGSVDFADDPLDAPETIAQEVISGAPPSAFDEGLANALDHMVLPRFAGRLKAFRRLENIPTGTVPDFGDPPASGNAR